LTGSPRSVATLETLLDVETETEFAFDSLFSAAPYSLAAGGTDTAAALTTPRTEIKAEVIKWGPHQYTPATGTYAGRAIYDQFLVRLTLDVVYQPEHGQGQASIRGKIRAALTDWTRIKTAFATHAYLRPAPDTLQQQDGGRTIDDEEKTETLTTILEFVAFIRPDALDAAT